MHATDAQSFGELVTITAIAVAVFYRVLRRNVGAGPNLTATSATETSLIVTLYSVGVTLQKVSDGPLLQFHYAMLATSDNPHATLPAGTTPVPGGQTILRLDMPTASQVHIVGYNLHDAVFSRLLLNTSLDNMLGQVQPEGDFPDYFRILCDKGREVELLEVLDPPRLAYLLDFCQRFNWELIENSLYFVQSAAPGQGGEGLNMVQADEEFAQKILPTLQRMSSSQAQSHLAQ